MSDAQLVYWLGGAAAFFVVLSGFAITRRDPASAGSFGLFATMLLIEGAFVLVCGRQALVPWFGP